MASRAERLMSEVTAEALSAAIERSGLTLTEIAETCEVERSSASRWRSGKFMPRGASLVKLDGLLRSRSVDVLA